MACEQMQVKDLQVLSGRIGDGELQHLVLRSQRRKGTCVVYQPSNLSFYVDADDLQSVAVLY
jgi:hypothetical protein